MIFCFGFLVNNFFPEIYIYIYIYIYIICQIISLLLLIVLTCSQKFEGCLNLLYFCILSVAKFG